MEYYIDGLVPVIQSPLQMEQTKLLVREFVHGKKKDDATAPDDDSESEGKRLQKLLIEYSGKTDNWVSGIILIIIIYMTLEQY
ncbi:hypothetical protein BLA29_012132 [Euroglyphus maynei]|uniref:Uncharacterized protein n=1 Tax=Euroglyphus maynei TaxID=6958 RepID=A0A1Y3AT52_EURMA|nr:hypothetical protein BLA29_012132 [Euroglyphus maynei]